MAYDRQDDPREAEALLAGATLFSLEIERIVPASRTRSLDHYSDALDVQGGPKANTMMDMYLRGLQRIKRELRNGRAPLKVEVTHDAFGKIRTHCSYSESRFK